MTALPQFDALSPIKAHLPDCREMTAHFFAFLTNFGSQ